MSANVSKLWLAFQSVQTAIYKGNCRILAALKGNQRPSSSRYKPISVSQPQKQDTFEAHGSPWPAEVKATKENLDGRWNRFFIFPRGDYPFRQHWKEAEMENEWKLN